VFWCGEVTTNATSVFFKKLRKQKFSSKQGDRVKKGESSEEDVKLNLQERIEELKKYIRNHGELLYVVYYYVIHYVYIIIIIIILKNKNTNKIRNRTIINYSVAKTVKANCQGNT